MTPSRLRPTARTLFAALAALALALTNVAAGCPGDPPPPIDLPVLATTAAVGSLPGSTSVSDDGTFTYSAPIPVPPGRAGMQPSLALSYASTPSEGSLGVGFALSGLSSITRCGQSVAIDGQHRGVELDDDDRLCLDGARLLAVEGEDMQAGTIYRTETETWRRIETVESDRVGVTGPVTLRVRMPDGRERLYGASNDSRLEITRADGSRVVATWFLTLERDPRGNAIRYGYDHVTPTLPAELAALADPDPATYDLVRISRIDYTGTANDLGTLTSPGTRSVRFTYASTPRTPDRGVLNADDPAEEPGVEDGFFEGSYGWRASAFPLERVRTYVEEDLVHELRLVGETEPVSRRYRLTSAQLCANAPPAPGTTTDAGLVCMPRTTFTWRNQDASSVLQRDERYGEATFETGRFQFDGAPLGRDWCEPGAESGQFCDDAWPTLALDANGDGADDLVYLRSGSNSPTRLAIRYGGYTNRARRPLDLPIGSWPLRRVRDVVLEPDVPGRDLGQIVEQLQYADTVDWNTDGRDDLLFVIPTTDASLFEVIAVLSLGSERFRVQPTGLFIPRSLGQTEFHSGAFRGFLSQAAVRRNIETLDVNGDGRTDVLVCLEEADLLDPNGTVFDRRYFDGRGNLIAAPGRWWYATRNEDGSLGLPTSGGRRGLVPSTIETVCAFEYGGIEGRIQSPLSVSPDFPYYDFWPRTLDSDGDGAEELVVAPPWFTRTYGTPAPDTNVRLARWDTASNALVAVATNVPNERFQAVDLNGDGLHDLLAEHASYLRPDLRALVPADFDQVLSVAYLSRGDGRFDVQLPQVAIPGRRRALFRRWLGPRSRGDRWTRWPLPMLGFDINGDNRGDLLTLHVAPTEVDPEARNLPRSHRLLRWHDASVSVLEFLTGQDDVAYSTGVTLPGEQHLNGELSDDALYSTPFVVTPMPMDVDGDGALDLVAVPRRGLMPVPGARAGDGSPLEPLPNPFLPSALLLEVHHNVRSQPQLIERIQDGFGGETIARYTPLSDSTVYRPSRDCSYPTRCTTDSRYVVQYVLHDDGSDGRAYVEEQHYYAGGRVDLQGRGFLGFQRHAVRNTLTGETIDRRFDNATYDPVTRSYPYAGQPRSVMQYGLALEGDDRGDTQFVGSKQTFRHALVTTPEGTHFTVLRSAVSRDYEENGVPVSVIFGGDPFLGLAPLRQSRRVMTHDDFGNVTSSVEVLTGVPGLARTDATFVNDTERWRIGLPDTQTSQTIEGEACSLYERMIYSVDVALAEVVSVTRTGRAPDASMDQTTTFVRDARGNVVSASVGVTSPGVPARTVSLTYEPTGYFVDSITNALRHRTEVSVEARFGQIHHVTDANGVETVRSFDGFGRVREERSSGRGGAEITYELADELGRHQVRIEPDGGGHQVVEYDRLGRAVESQVEHAFVTSYAARRFDRLGRLVLETEPFTDPALLFDLDSVPQTRAEHDDMGRVLSTLSADGVRTVYGYPRNAREVQTEGGGEYVTELDAAGRVLAVVEPGSTSANRTTYQYCRSGLLRRTFDPAGNTTTVEYDDLGRRTLLDDPAAGVARFSYDAFDDLERTEDALGRVNRWERDVLGRVEALHHDAEGITDRFFYDTAPRGTSGATVLGALASTESGDGVIDTFEYDGLARSVAQSRLVDGRLLRVSSTLDELGRVTSTSYPDALGLGAVVLSTSYDTASGEPVAVDLDGRALWELRGQDARGVPSEERLGSGSWGVIDRLSEYSAAGRLETLTSISGSAVLQDLHYGYSLRGLLAQREDGVAGRTETFEHDALSRLTAVSEAGLSAPRERYTIDAIGNLVSTHEGSVLYEDPSRPYAATEARGETVEYDDVGNAFHVGDLSLTYTQRNLPRTVDSGKTGLVQYRYDASGGRATKRSRDVDITYFGAYELERRGMLLYERISLSTPAGVVAQLERANGGAGQNGTSRLRWLLSERQGSVETTWVNGEAPAHHRYDAYGGVLSSGGSATGERPSPSVSAGYTGHEHEDDLGLVNMGGRVYSPTLRRFLTADPVVMTPFGQGLNAYSYVRGNPLNATDPFGWYDDGVSPISDLPSGVNEQGDLPGYTTSTGSGGWGLVFRRSADATSSETAGAAPSGGAPAQATDSEQAGPPRGQGGQGFLDGLRSDVQSAGSLDAWVERNGQRLARTLSDAAPAVNALAAGGARASLVLSASLVPGVGEAMDMAALNDDELGVGSRIAISVTLGLGWFTAGLSPNAGALHRAAGEMGDALSAAGRVNLDTGTAIALVSEGSPVRHAIRGMIDGRHMVMTETALSEFSGTLLAAGPREQARAQRLLERVAAVADDPSARALGLTVTQKVGAADIRVFGTADRLGITTITSDAKFLSGAAAQGVHFDALVHAPQPFTGL